MGSPTLQPGGSPRSQEERGTRGKHGFPREREPEASVAHAVAAFPRYASITLGSLLTSAGEPSLIFSP